MAQRKKTVKKTGSRGLHDALDRIEKELPPNLRKVTRQLRKGLIDLEKQVEKTRRDSERRWERQQTQVRREIASLLRKLEKAVEPKKRTRKSAPRKTTRSKATTTKVAAS